MPAIYLQKLWRPFFPFQTHGERCCSWRSICHHFEMFCAQSAASGLQDYTLTLLNGFFIHSTLFFSNYDSIPLVFFSSIVLGSSRPCVAFKWTKKKSKWYVCVFVLQGDDDCALSWNNIQQKNLHLLRHQVCRCFCFFLFSPLPRPAST